MATQNTDFIAGIPIYSPAAVYSYDNAGNITSDGLHTDYFYNQNNRLIRVEIDGLTVAEYAYDAFERRVMKVVNGVVTHFHYDPNGLLISQTDGNGEPVAMKVYGGSAGWYWFVNDHLGTPQKMVDESGTVVWAAACAPFGEARVYKDEVVNNLRFPGQYYDVETGLHYNWHRYYDPGTGRYLTPDPIGIEGGLNVYAYCFNNPINMLDVYGREPASASEGAYLIAGWGYAFAEPTPVGEIVMAVITGAKTVESILVLLAEKKGEGEGKKCPVPGQSTPPPKKLKGFPDTESSKPKTPVQGGGGLRKRWKDGKGNIYEWDSQHGRVEKFNKRGKHLGEYDPKTGKQTKPPKPGRKGKP